MYRIKENYTPRLDNDYDPEIIITDDYQNEVYLEAKKIVLENGFKSVLDVGTGRAFKLMKYFKDLNTLGLDLPPTVEWLTSPEGYPDRKWMSIPLDEGAPQGYDLVICADVIEHVVDPDILCEFINRTHAKFAVISTPDRALLSYRGAGPTWNSDDGPPFNSCHVREWTFREFGLYMQDHFNVILHWYPNEGQKTQGVIVKLR